MKGLAITNIGIEDAAASEISGLISSKTEKRKGCVIFDAKKHEDFFKLCYRSQSARKIMLLLSHFKIKTIEEIEKEIKNLDISEWISEKTTFVVRSTARNTKIRSQELEPEVGGFIIEKTNAKVELESPSTTFFVFIEGNECYLGIDFSGDDLGKRDYRVFTGSDILKPNVAFSLLRIAGYKPEDSLLDPFCASGTIPIEAALYATQFPVKHFSKDSFLFLNMKNFEKFDFQKFFEAEDKKADLKKKTQITAADSSFQAISAAKKNAKIAGVMKSISFSRKEPKWLDAKFSSGSVDKIVSFIPHKKRMLYRQNAEKLFEELFYQAEFILKKGGIVALLLNSTEHAEKSAEKYKFKLREKRKVMQGKSELDLVVFEK